MNIKKIFKDLYNYRSKDIFSAIKNDDMERFKRIVKSGYNLNTQMNEGYTPILYAWHYSRIKMIDLLLDQKDIDLFVEVYLPQGKYYYSNINEKITIIDAVISHCTICYSQIDSWIKLLIKILSYENIDLKKLNKKSILYECLNIKIPNNNPLSDELVDIAIERTSDLDKVNFSGETALTIACSHNFEKIALKLLSKTIALKLLSKTIDINKQIYYGSPAILYSCYNAMFKVQKKLINKSCKVIYKFNTFFNITIAKNQYKILKYYYLKQFKN